MRPANPEFEHSAAPDWNLLRFAEVVDAARGRIPSHAPELDIDDAAGAQLDGRPRVLLGMDAFIEANRRVELALQFGMAVQIIPSERLLDHHQVIRIQTFQVR